MPESKSVVVSEKSVTRQNKVYVAVILDCSGSMGAMRQEALDAYNDLIVQIKKEAHTVPTDVSFITFNTVPHKPKVWCEAANKLQKLTLEDYTPEGLTALFDTVAKTVNELDKQVDANGASFLVNIISDGYENNSKEHTAEAIAALINSKQKTGRWTFTYLGANQDLAEVSRQMGIPQANMCNFVASPDGMKRGAYSMRVGTTSYFASVRAGGQSVADFYDGQGEKEEEWE